MLALTGPPATAGLARVASHDRTPPAFAGLKSATTCLPGPLGGGRSAEYRLSWDAAKDDVTPQKKIVYDIYQATSPGGEDLSSATYTARHGVTTFDDTAAAVRRGLLLRRPRPLRRPATATPIGSSARA